MGQKLLEPDGVSNWRWLAKTNGDLGDFLGLKPPLCQEPVSPCTILDGTKSTPRSASSRGPAGQLELPTCPETQKLEVVGVDVTWI